MYVQTCKGNEEEKSEGLEQCECRGSSYLNTMHEYYAGAHDFVVCTKYCCGVHRIRRRYTCAPVNDIEYALLMLSMMLCASSKMTI